MLMEIIDLEKPLDKGNITIEMTIEEAKKYNLKVGQEIEVLELLGIQDKQQF